MREYGRPSPNNRTARDARGEDRRRRAQRQDISGLAAEFADAIRRDDRDALDRAQAALHRLGRQGIPRV